MDGFKLIESTLLYPTDEVICRSALLFPDKSDKSRVYRQVQIPVNKAVTRLFRKRSVIEMLLSWLKILVDK